MQTKRETNPDLRRINAALVWRGGYASEQSIRSHSFVVDEPVKLGGTDAGPTPLEYTLGAYDGCLQIVIAMVAGEMGISVRRIAITSTAEVDRRGLFGTAPVSPHYRRIETIIDLELEAPASEETVLERIQKRLYARCPMYNLFNDAGIALDLRWNVSVEPAA